MYHQPYNLGSQAEPIIASSSTSHYLEPYSYSPTSSSLIKTSPSLPPCQPYKTSFSSSLSALGDYTGGVTTYQPQYQHNLAFTDQANLSSANSLLTNTVPVTDFPNTNAIIKTENDNCDNLDEEEDTTEEEKSDKEDCKGDNNKPPYSYVAMIGEYT